AKVFVENGKAIADLAEDFGQVWCRHRDDSHYKFVIRNSQFECAILLDSSARTVAAPALLMKRSNKLRLRWREVQMIIRGLASTRHVLLAHIIPMRRCNLAC